MRWAGARRPRPARFVVHPGLAPPPPPLAWGRAAAFALALVVALDLALGGAAVLLVDALAGVTPLLPAPIEEDIPLAEDLFLALLLAPVLEELLFRGWLTGRVAALRFAAYGFAALGLFLASLPADPGLATMLGLAGVAAGFAGLVHWSRTRHRDTAVPGWFLRHFGKLVWAQALLFGLIHLGHYEPLAHPLGVLVVLPQTIGGLLLAYTRVRLGLLAAIAHHAAFNAAAMVLERAGF